MVALNTINHSKLTLVYPNDPRPLQTKLVRHSSLSFWSGKFLHQNCSFCDNWYLKMKWWRHSIEKVSKVVENNRPGLALNLPLHSSVSQRFFWVCIPSASTPGHFDLFLAAQNRSRILVHFWSQGPQSVQLLQLPWRASWKVQYRGKRANI